MKRILAIILVILTVLPLVACSSSLANEPTAEETKTEVKTEEKKTEEKAETGPITLPQGFSVGYSRQDITPISWPTLSYNGDYAKSAHDPLQITCVALCDGEQIALICTIDMRNIGAALIQKTKELLTKNLEKK